MWIETINFANFERKKIDVKSSPGNSVCIVKIEIILYSPKIILYLPESITNNYCTCIVSLRVRAHALPLETTVCGRR